MSNLGEVWKGSNLLRAYRWILSNPDARYKGYFRDAYTAFAASSKQNLEEIQRRLKRDTYEPSHASKVYLAKPSGILRPYTLLTVNDQVVYQACINVVAATLYPRIRQRYYRTVFGHLYAGTSSRWFYQRWQDGYIAYTRRVQEYIDDGFDQVATFDLTAFYDSIDHHTLRYFLEQLSLDREFIDFLMDCLRVWTSSTWTNVSNVIYQRHGIPQGPLSSGLLSEVILRHLDNAGIRSGNVRYIRYVDDIHLFATDATSLRKRLVGLDLASKEIGLFPQSSKIEIRQISTASEAVKNLSLAPSRPFKLVRNPDKAQRRLLELSRRGKISKSNASEFKFLLGSLAPGFAVSNRLLAVLENHPELAESISRYLTKYEKFPASLSRKITVWLIKEHVYHASLAGSHSSDDT